MGIEKALNLVRSKISDASERSGRNPADVKLVSVSKTIAAPTVIEAIRAGASILGENRIQEARDKAAVIRASTPDAVAEWHLIGNLQKNKAKYAVQLFDLIHSVDTISLANELDKHARKVDKVQRILVQVKLSDEVTKHGVNEADLPELLDKVSTMYNLKLEGLMTMPPFFADPDESRPYFRKLKQIADYLNDKGFSITELSMGMSNDYEVAIEEGATLVRVGTAIFGKRTY